MFPLIVVLTPYTIDIEIKNKFSILGGSLILLFILFSSCLSHDYLSWNRARWQGINYLVKDLKITPGFIDGGIEFNGWYQTAPISNGKKKSWWFVDKDDYILTFGPLAGYEILKLIPYQQYVPFKKKDIYILKKQ
jgi:hypothetical protein